MQYDTIRYAVRDDVGIIRLNRPDVKNALNTQMRAELLHILRHVAEDARVAVITGTGDAFCSGQDLSDRGNAANLDLERTLRDEYEPMLRAIADCPIPVMSAVNGAAAGAGANLALAADVVIAAESAMFLQAFTRIGLIPDAGGTYWLPRQIGFAKAMGAALFADPIPAPQAEAWGMIWETAPDDQFEDHWWQRARQLATGPTMAYGAVKSALRKSFDNVLADQLSLEARLQGSMGKTRDFQEGVVAFMEKRPAKFEGR